MASTDEKHTALVESSPGVVSCLGGDHTGAPYADIYRNDGHDLTLATNSWKQFQAYGAPDPKPPRPDTGGIGCDPKTGDLLWVPGLLIGNESPSSSNPSCAWWRSKATGLWRQDKGLVWSAGMIRGGVPDWPSRQWISVYESSTKGPVITLWGIDDFSKQTTITWGEPGVGSKFTYYAADSLPCVVGRVMYFVARTLMLDGTAQTRFFGFDIDAKTVKRLATPPLTSYTVPESTLLAGAGTKVVFPHIQGPEGVILALLVYDTTTDKWTQELTRPFGLPGQKFLMNAICPLPSRGSILMGGAGLGSTKQTHLIEFKP